MHFLGKVLLVGPWRQVEEAAELAAERPLRAGAAGPERSLRLLLTSGQPQREFVYDQPGRDLERQHLKTDPTQSLEHKVERGRDEELEAVLTWKPRLWE